VRIGGLCLGLAAVLLLASTALAADTTHYVRLRLSPDGKHVMYVQFQGTEMRMATTVDGLAKAEVVKGRDTSRPSSYKRMSFPPVGLPAVGETPPKGTKTTVEFHVVGYPRRTGRGRTSTTYQMYVQTFVRHSRTDAKKVQWMYEFYEGTRPGTAAAKAPQVRVPVMGRLTLKVVAKPARKRQVGVGLYLMAGRVNLHDVKKAGKPCQVTVRVLDAKGAEVSKAAGPLSKFGFG
jgi:hypothetical protein